MANLNSGPSQPAGINKEKSLQRLLEVQLKEIDDLSKKIDVWNNYKKEYRDLKTSINIMKEKVKHPYRVPIAGSQLAFVDGEIIHTNEYLVLLGENHFALRSASQANKIIDRRLSNIEDMLNQSIDAKKKTGQWLQAVQEHKRDKEQFVEIIETM